VSINGMDATTIGVASITVSTNATAGSAMSLVQKAISTVSDQRSTLGALQNRLEHTVANLDTTSENTSASESRIRDTDMAAEMVEYSKNNILAQAGQSMLAQANQSTQGVLSLLG
ncbi:MAG: flagellin, partial [Lachnospiraceae bacterium]|nr:flagellin [Lachnospiraceae bacterium]